MEQAKRLGYDYVLRGQIAEWEDNATEWSSKADSAGLSVELFDLAPAVIASGTHRIKGSGVDFATHTPDRFIPELVTAGLGSRLGSATASVATKLRPRHDYSIGTLPSMSACRP